MFCNLQKHTSLTSSPENAKEAIEVVTRKDDQLIKFTFYYLRLYLLNLRPANNILI